MNTPGTIEGFLTLKFDAETVLDKRPALLVIDEPSETGYVHRWHIDNIKTDQPLQELEAISNMGMEDESAHFQVSFDEDNSENTYTGKAFISRLSFDDSIINIQGASPLES